MSIVVGPGLERRTHHISLSDGVNSLGLILCDSAGNVNPFAIARAPVPRTAMKTSSGNQKYSDFEPPWSPVAQEDWSGGRGMLDFDLDVTRYYDNWRANTLYGKIFLGGQENYSTGYRNQNFRLAGSLRWIAMLPGNRKYLAVRFSPSEYDYTAYTIYLWLKRKGTPPTALNVVLCSDSDDNPGSTLQSATVTTTDITDTVSQLYKIAITAQALNSESNYWIKVGVSTADSDNYWAVGVYDDPYSGYPGTTKESEHDETWSNSAINLYFRITDADNTYQTKFFTYKRQLYMIKNRTGDYPRIYINGDRGVADANTGALTTLVDATKEWNTDEWAHSIVMLIGGPGSNEAKPWREIVSNTATTLTLDSAWLTTHTTNTEYVIVNSNKWTLVPGLNTTGGGEGIASSVTDVLVVNNICYFAEGDSNVIQRMRWYNNAGVATYELGDDGNHKATFMCTVRDATNGLEIWIANNLDADSKISVAKSAVKEWGTNLVPGDAIPFLDDYGKITGICEYGPTTKLLWIFREGSIFTLSGTKPDEIPLKEMHAAAEYTNGSVFLAHNVYLYFNFGNGLERYYNSLLDDVGPNRDDGLPSDRQGVISCMAGYPGKIFVGIDAGILGTSCVLGNAQDAASGAGWNEIYRAPAVGQRILNMAFQPIPGEDIDKLWLAVGADIIWIPFPSGSTEPIHDTRYRYIHESTLTTGYIYVGLYDIYKFFHSLKIFAENLSATNGQWIEVDYQIDDDTAWTPVLENFDTSPMSEHKLIEDYGVNGKRIRFRLRLQTSDNTKTPVVKGIVVENVSRVPIKYSFSFSYRNFDEDVNLLGDPEILTAEERQSLLDGWAMELTPLIMCSNNKQYDNKTVFIDPAQIQAVKQTKEGYIEKMSVLEI
jgi:hypothetical protein